MGEEFEPVSLRSMIFSHDRALRRHRYEANIMQSPDSIFTATRQALIANKKNLEQIWKDKWATKSRSII